MDLARDKEPATVRCPTRIRALVADNSPGFRVVIGALLKIEDWIEVVARVSDGQEAIEAVTVLLPDLVLIDVGLAKLDGITTASILTHRFPSLDVVLMSDKHSSRLRATCQASRAKLLHPQTEIQRRVSATLDSIQKRPSVSRAQMMRKSVRIVLARVMTLYQRGVNESVARSSH